MDAVHSLVLAIGIYTLLDGTARSNASQVPNIVAYRASGLPLIAMGIALIVLAFML